MTVEVSEVRPTTSSSSASPAASVSAAMIGWPPMRAPSGTPTRTGDREQDPRIGECPRHLGDVQRQTRNRQQQKADDVAGVARGQHDRPEDRQNRRKQQEIPDQRNRQRHDGSGKTEPGRHAEDEQADAPTGSAGRAR